MAGRPHVYGIMLDALQAHFGKGRQLPGDSGGLFHGALDFGLCENEGGI
jgi:hypothetical protein